MKRQIALLICIALVSFLAGTMFNMNYLVMGNGDSKPWDKVWTTISQLQSKLDELNALYTDLVERVEMLEYPKNGFVGYWNFDEASGQIAYDESGNSNGGRIYGPSWVEGKLGSALSFDGVNDYVEVMHSPTLYFPNITVMAWVNFRRFPDAGDYGGNPVSMIVAKGTRDNFDGWFGLEECWKPEVFRFSFREHNQLYGIDGTTQIVLGKWYHVAGTYDGSILRLYLQARMFSMVQNQQELLLYILDQL